MHPVPFPRVRLGSSYPDLVDFHFVSTLNYTLVHQPHFFGGVESAKSKPASVGVALYLSTLSKFIYTLIIMNNKWIGLFDFVVDISHHMLFETYGTGGSLISLEKISPYVSFIWGSINIFREDPI